MASVINAAMRSLVEGFANPGSTEAYRMPSVYTESIAVILTFLVALILVALVGQWLWNFSVVPLFEFARPAKSVFEILGLMVFLAIIAP